MRNYEDITGRTRSAATREPRRRMNTTRAHVTHARLGSPRTGDVLDVVVEHRSAGVALAATLTGVTPLTSAVPTPQRERAGGSRYQRGGTPQRGSAPRCDPLLHVYCTEATVQTAMLCYFYTHHRSSIAGILTIQSVKPPRSVIDVNSTLL